MNRVILIVLAIILILTSILLTTLFGVRTGQESAFHIKSDENTVLFGVTPWGDARQAKDAYGPLLKYLSEKTGKKFQLLVMEDYNSTIDNVTEGTLDICVMPPVSYVKAKNRKPGIQYIATIVREQDDKAFATYKGYLIALKSKYEGWSFDDFLKNSKEYNLAFVTKNSSSGWAYPMAMMKKRGIDPDKAFKSVTIYDSHPAVTGAIVSGKVDVGATWEYNLENARQKYGDIFAIVYTTPDIPGLAWIASEKIDPSFVKKMRQLLEEVNSSKELKEVLLKDTPDKGWMVMDEGFYDGVREVLKYVGDFK